MHNALNVDGSWISTDLLPLHRAALSALSRWESEGGSVAEMPSDHNVYQTRDYATTPLADAEIVQLRIRIIALENLVVSLLAQAPAQNRRRAREMATYISPRAGFTAHPVTLRAAAQMRHLIAAADEFQSHTTPSSGRAN